MLPDYQNFLSGEPTVFIVDDEELLREVTCKMIEDNGGQTRFLDSLNATWPDFRA